MDDPGSKHVEGGEGEGVTMGHHDARRKHKHPLLILVFRGCFVIAFGLFASFISFLIFGVLALIIGSFSGRHGPVSVPALCRVVSSSVDLRSSKVCELALSNYKAKYVIYPSGKTKVLCHDDYYWASVFKVEYKEYFSGRTHLGVAESPKEALPLYCRPSFATTWLTKSKFKVNETYQCRYSLGTFKADIYPDHLFNCQAEDPSMLEMMRRFFILFLNSASSFSWDSVRGRRHILAAVTGTLGGILSSMCLVAVVKIFHLSRLALSKKWGPVKHHLTEFAIQFRRACLLIAYISAVGYLTLQYSQFVGLKQLFFDSDSGTATTR